MDIIFLRLEIRKWKDVMIFIVDRNSYFTRRINCCEGRSIHYSISFILYSSSEFTLSLSPFISNLSSHNQNIILVLLLLGVIIAVLAFVVMQTTQSLVGKRLGEYVRQTITANPE